MADKNKVYFHINGEWHEADVLEASMGLNCLGDYLYDIQLKAWGPRPSDVFEDKEPDMPGVTYREVAEGDACWDTACHQVEAAMGRAFAEYMERVSELGERQEKSILELCYQYSSAYGDKIIRAEGIGDSPLDHIDDLCAQAEEAWCSDAVEEEQDLGTVGMSITRAFCR